MSGSGSILNRPPWLALTALSAILTGLACYPSWPGYMSYDSLLAYEQALFGVRTALWPPLHTFMVVAAMPRRSAIFRRSASDSLRA